mmetsp:Transcript_57516/g.136828  ORF Transcript_57516/g.136828 Transcript_57516/m.136828 type:complete len:184 (-) Transcript_57516:983-1534(-)
MALFDEGGGFEGALATKEPKVPPRRRRAPAADNESEAAGGEGATNSPPAPKKSVGGGWANVDSAAAPAASGGESTAIGSMKEPSGKGDEDIMAIPDLEEADEDDITMAVAEPGAVTGAALPTNLADEQGLLPPSMADGIDLSLLYEAILPKKQLQVDLGSWDPDQMLNNIKQTMQEEEDKKAE